MRDLSELITFLDKLMSMSEIYQPAIILYLLEQDGTASKNELATILSGYDESVQEYYQKILMRWPKQTLTKHEIIIYDKPQQTFILNFDLSNGELLDRAKIICKQKIEQWILKRLETKETSYVEASKRYRVLKAAHGKCELCGISSKISPIDIDHIVPESKADKHGYVIKDGERMHCDDERNLQALCFRCNRAKRNTDETDFRLPTKKLIRDKLPEIITSSGRVPIIKQVTGSELEKYLLEKLTEEHVELLDNSDIEEISDMIEVLINLAHQKGHSEEEVMSFVHKKRFEKGGFEQGMLLEAIIS